MSEHLDIKSLAALKRALTVGTRLRVIDHWNPDLRNTSRVITKTQTNGVYFQVPESDKWKNAWMPYPPAKNVSFPAPGRVRFVFGERSWELEFEEMP
jgi:hypothetical protein